MGCKPMPENSNCLITSLVVGLSGSLEPRCRFCKEGFFEVPDVTDLTKWCQKVETPIEDCSIYIYKKLEGNLRCVVCKNGKTSSKDGKSCVQPKTIVEHCVSYVTSSVSPDMEDCFLREKGYSIEASSNSCEKDEAMPGCWIGFRGSCFECNGWTGFYQGFDQKCYK